MPPLDENERRDRHWRSLEDLGRGRELEAERAREFPPGAEETPDAVSRRGFLKLMGASAALAGMSGCRWPRETIVPQTSRQAGVDPGSTRRFATTLEIAGVGHGLLVTSVDGRPIKVEGNPLHPVSRGAADAAAQACVLELYDPDRAKAVIRAEGGDERMTDWAEFDAWAVARGEELARRRGEGLFVLAEASSSETLAAQRRRLAERFPAASFHEYEPLSLDNAAAGARLAYGRPLRTLPRLERAEVILALDADILGAHPAAVGLARDFAAGRDPEGAMNRLYAVESAYSLTGAMADHRHVVRADRIEGFALALAASLLEVRRAKLPRGLSAIAARLAVHADRSGDDAFLAALVADLDRAGPKAVVLVGERQPAAVHALGHLLNEALGARGETVTLIPVPAGGPDAGGSTESLRELAAAMRGGRVRTLLVLGGNPAYDAPADIDFASALAAVPEAVHLSLHHNETSRGCAWRLPRAHVLEAWGDARAWDGTLCAAQPLIAPLYDGRTPAEILALLAGGEARPASALVREALADAAGVRGDGRWRRLLHDGTLAGSAPAPVGDALRAEALGAALPARSRQQQAAGLLVEFLPDHRLRDGRFANNAWLQELPDPLTRMTWDNAVLIAPATAAARGIATGDVLRLELGQRRLAAPAYVMPGQAPDAVAIALGHGRTAAGGVGEGVGADAYRLRGSEAMGFATGLKAVKSGGRHEFALTQDHHQIDTRGAAERGRRAAILAREGTKAQYDHDPDFVRDKDHHPPLVSLWQEHAYDGHRWGMSVDLNACIGCGACTVACQSENNIPVVGKDQVARGREMHWIRIDRYFKGDPADPTVSHLPVTCSHCELAPCEQVCPVGATVHSSEGLNDMVYNRCIGTRYCSNNCPYKVRRFNFYNYHPDVQEVEKLGHNPEVTVRSRGVMEKCTFCVQRIQGVKIDAKNAGREIADGEIQTACQQTCPTKAIRFGDLNDAKSDIVGHHGNPRAYVLLEELNIKPRLAHLGRIRNPNPALSPAEDHEHGAH